MATETLGSRFIPFFVDHGQDSQNIITKIYFFIMFSIYRKLFNIFID